MWIWHPSWIQENTHPPKQKAGTWTWVFPLEVWRFLLETHHFQVPCWISGGILHHLTHLTDNAPDIFKYQPPTEGGYQITKKTWWWIHSVEKTYHMLVKLGESFQRIEKNNLKPPPTVASSPKSLSRLAIENCVTLENSLYDWSTPSLTYPPHK